MLLTKWVVFGSFLFDNVIAAPQEDEVPGVFPFNIVIEQQTGTQVSFSWTYDPCVGVVGPGRKKIPDLKAVDGKCIDKKGEGVERLVVNAGNGTFPHGAVDFRLLKGQNPTRDQQTFRPKFENTTVFLESTRRYTLDIDGQYPSDWYVLSITAWDEYGNLVKGHSPYFAIGAPPALSPLTLHTPVEGSYWTANTLHRVRFEPTFPNQVFTNPRYHMDLLTEQGALVSRIAEALPPIAPDQLLGGNRNVQYLVWKIDKALANRRFKLRITAVTAVGDVTSQGPGYVVESGIFTIGIAKPGKSCWEETDPVLKCL